MTDTDFVLTLTNSNATDEPCFDNVPKSSIPLLFSEQRTAHEKQLGEVRDKLEQKITLLKKQHEEELREFDQLLNDELNRVHKKYQTELRRLREQGKYLFLSTLSGFQKAGSNELVRPLLYNYYLCCCL